MTQAIAIGDDRFVESFSIAYGAHRMRHSAALRFVGAFGSLDSWQQLTLDEQLDTPIWAKPIIVWAVLTGRIVVDAYYVVACRSGWGKMAARLHPGDHERFTDAATSMGFTPWETDRQWAVYAKIVAGGGGGSPLALALPAFTSAHDRILIAASRLRRSVPRTYSTPLFGLNATLFHLGVLDQPPPRSPGRCRRAHRGGNRFRRAPRRWLRPCAAISIGSHSACGRARCTRSTRHCEPSHPGSPGTIPTWAPSPRSAASTLAWKRAGHRRSSTEQTEQMST